MKKEKSELDLLHTGTAYLEVHTFKGKDYITVKDFSTTTNALSKKMLELEEENKKLRDLKCVPSNLKTLIRIDKENERLEEENKNLKEKLEKLTVRIYEKMPRNMRKEYQEFCGENNI